MGISSAEFVKEIQRMVQKKHSKDHPIIGLIEQGKLDREQLKGFIGQFYLFFPKPFPKPIAAMLSRCPDDAELEKMWIENVNGLTKHYGFDRNSEDIRYWTLHMGVDEEHMKVGPLAVERYAVTEPQQAQVRASVQKTLDQFWLAFDGIKRAFVDKDPLYAKWRNGN